MPPYSAVWSNVPAGSYSLTAKATDNLGAMRSSPAVAITVTGSGPTVLYLHGDRLGTPRVATNEANVVVWRNLPTGEPFGMALPEEEPDGDGRATVINLRFPGQYFDRETQLQYNYFRDYDPGTGRYVQSDPIGLAGGINTYGYVEANPVSLADPFGLMGVAPGRGKYPPGQGPGNFPPDEVMCKLKCATANDARQIRCANAYAMCMMQYKDPEMGRPRGLQSGASLRCLQEFEKCSVPFNQCKTKCECQ